MTTILWFLKRVVWFVKDNWKIVLPIFAVLVLVIFINRACSKPAKFDEKAIADAQDAIKEKNDEKLKEVLANADVKEKVIAGEVANAAANTEAIKQEAKKKYDSMSAQELQAEFNRQAGIK